MGFGKAVKNLFWTSESDDSSEQPAAAAPDGEGDAGAAEELSDEEFAALLADSPHAVPADAVDPVPAETVTVTTDPGGAVAIDFQAQYDAAGIPDTDEVEQLENFLERLDPQLPQTSKVAAAQAFLGAIGKSKDDVLTDAERKIRRVHGIIQSKQAETQETLATEQQSIDALQQQIDAHRENMQRLNQQLEGVRRACLIEESRLQAARVFFGNVHPPAGGVQGG